MHRSVSGAKSELFGCAHVLAHTCNMRDDLGLFSMLTIQQKADVHRIAFA